MEPVANPRPTDPDPSPLSPSEVEELRAFKTSRSGTLSRRKTIEAEAEDAPPPPPGNILQVPIKALMKSAIGKWISSYLKALPKKTMPLPKPGASNSIYRFENQVKIAMAGDWGAGTTASRRVACGMAAHEPNLTIHLGDVYYSGSRREYEGIFLGSTPGQWPVGSGSGGCPKVLALNGNHEMYSGGEGYFGLLVGPSGKFGQETSYFCLENDHWRIVALDTGYNTPGSLFKDFWLDFVRKSSNTIPDENLDWLKNVIFKDASDRRPVILLSHHQPIDGFGRCYSRMRRQIAPFLDRVAVWFWGHEHQLTLLAAVQVEEGKTLRGRCIGHGGKPVEPHTKLPKGKYPIVWTDTRARTVRDGTDQVDVGYCGYVVMHFNGDEIAIEYFEEPAAPHGGGSVGTGDLLLREVIRTDASGAVTRRLETFDASKRLTEGSARPSQL